MDQSQVINIVLGYSITLITVFFGIWRWDAKRTLDRDKAIDTREKEIRKDYEGKIDKLNTSISSLQESVNVSLNDVVKANTKAMENQTQSLNRLSETQQTEVTAIEALTASVGRLGVEINGKIDQLKTQLDAILKFINSKEESSSTLTNEILKPEKLEQ